MMSVVVGRTRAFDGAPPPGMVIMHAFGRHCLGFKWAGEIDVHEATDHVCTQYPIDEDRTPHDHRCLRRDSSGLWGL